MQQIEKDITLDKFGIHQRLVREEDADFIFNLRQDPKLSRFLSKTTGTVQDQRDWITRYREREKNKEEFYFITIFENERQGVNRLYNFQGDTFEVGSWLFRQTSPGAVAILADIAVRDFAFEELGFNNCIFDVRKDNKSVVNYHKMFGPELYGTDEDSFKFKLSKANYLLARQKILKIYKYEA